MIVNVDNLHVMVDQTTILNKIAFQIKKGQFIGLIGPNGSGKSTLLQTLTGFISKVEGQLLIDNKPIQKYKSRELARLIGYVPQDTHIDFSFKAKDIVLMGRHPYLSRFGTEGKRDLEIAEEAMSMTDTLHLANRMVTDMSGGQRQMIFIAKALAQQPKILLLDEPISALDIRYQLRVLDLIEYLTSKGITAIAALHDLNLAARYCDRLILLSEGELIYQGTPREVLTSKTIDRAYGVESKIYDDPWLGHPAITALSESKNQKDNGGNYQHETTK